MRNIAIPNLPDRSVGLVLVKNDIPLIKELSRYGITAVSPVKNSLIADEVSEHADMLFCMPECGICIVSREQTALRQILTDLGFNVAYSSKQVAGKYPGDIILNFSVGKDFILGNIPYADKELISSVKKKDKISVRQGYAKCSTCFVTENAFITEDSGIAGALSAKGFDVLRIQSGDVYLSEAHSGFFGGATGKISKDTLAINGSLEYHTDGDSIRRFLRKHGVTPLELSDSRIKDIGGIIPLKEE